jgi:CMP-N-acetylneuraminic acid synthetase
MFMSERKVIALLPMKGHSERVADKNIKLLGDEPLFYWVLRTLASLPMIKHIVINTDSEVIASYARRQFDVLIHERPSEICGDFVSMNRIIENDISRLPNEMVFLQTHATNPFLKPSTIAKAIESFFETEDKFDSVFSVTKYQSRFYDALGNPLNHDPAALIRTQDLPPIYEENSCFYLFSKNSFAASNARIGKTPKMFEVDPMESLDIDTQEDWRLAEAVAEMSESRHKIDASPL